MKTQKITVVLGIASLLVGLILLPPMWLSARAAAPVPRPVKAAGDCVVTTTTDSGVGSLRECMTNLQAGTTITFDVAVFPPTSPATITLASPLPAIVTDSVTIDGTGAGVILDGGALPLAGLGNGLKLDGANHCVIKGLSILNFPWEGIYVVGAKNNLVAENQIAGGQQGGITLYGPSTSNVITGNLIGTDRQGLTSFANIWGIYLRNGPQLNTITGNLISGNNFAGIELTGAGTTTNTIRGNTIGFDLNGGSLPNSGGAIWISNGSHNNIITNNLIGDNKVGIQLRQAGTTGNTIAGNRIDMRQSGQVVDWSATGVMLNVGSGANRLENNQIIGHTDAGVVVNESISNTIISNTIGGSPGVTLTAAGVAVQAVGSNTSYGILFKNAAQDNDIIGNDISLNSVGIGTFGEEATGNTRERNRIYDNAVKGLAEEKVDVDKAVVPGFTSITFDTVTGVAAPGSTVEIFSDDGWQAKYYHGSTTADDTGHFTLTVTGGFTGTNLTATATDLDGNTSQFAGSGGSVFESQNPFGSSLQSQANNCGDAGALGDFNQDGWLDSVVVATDSVGIWLNNGGGVFSSTSQSLNLIGGQAIALGDLDGDSDTDLLIGTGSGGTTLRNNGSGTFSQIGSGLNNSNTQAVVLGDVDGDGDLDAVTGTDQGGRVSLNNGSGSFTDIGQTLSSGNIQAVALGDTNGDGKLDVVSGGDNGSQVWQNNGSGTFSQIGQTLGTTNTKAVALGDTNGDGKLDLVLGGDNGSQVWLNNGGGTFSQISQILGGGQVIELGDTDSDGRLDLVLGGDDGSQVWLNKGSGTFTQTGQNLGDSTAIALGDLDNDNDLDGLALGSCQLWLNQNKIVRRLGPAGGTVTAVNSQKLTTTIEIAPGVLPQSTTLTYLPAVSPPQTAGQLDFAGRAFSLEATPAPERFNGPLTITVNYDPAEVSQDEMLLYYWDTASSKWLDVATTCVPTSTYARGSHYVRTALCHLTEFGLFRPSTGWQVYLPVLLKS